MNTFQAGETSSSDVPPFTICAQWTWDSTLAADKAPGIGAEAGHGGLGGVIHPVAPAGANQGLFPTRTAVFLFGGVHAAHGGLDGDSPCVVMVQVVASKLEHIRRCASHLKVWGEFKNVKGWAPCTGRHPAHGKP